MGRILSIILVGLLPVSAGCFLAAEAADVMVTQGFLAEAGFERLGADTPQQLAHIETLTQHQLVLHGRNGEPWYVYADAEQCRCIYVGDSEAYQRYLRKLKHRTALEGPIPGPRDIDPGLNWAMWELEE